MYRCESTLEKIRHLRKYVFFKKNLLFLRGKVKERSVQ